MSRFLAAALFALLSVSCVDEEEPDRPDSLAGKGGAAVGSPTTGVNTGSGGEDGGDGDGDGDDSEPATGGQQSGTPGLGWQDTCGDGFLDPGEACDDGNQMVGDGCSPTCCAELGNVCCSSGACYQLARRPCHCGDGVLDFDEECDDGNVNWGDGCSGYCFQETGLCGNGMQEPGEECDDGNLESADGCDGSCIREMGCF